MPLTPYTQLKGVTETTVSLLSDQLEFNLYSHLQWGFLNTLGAWVNVTRGMTGNYGGDFSLLRAVADPRFNAGLAGQVWETARKDWVWETGTSLGSGRVPTVCSGVWVNGTFHATATTTGTYQHALDFPNGRVVFTTPIPASSLVQCEYAFRRITVATADLPWWEEFQTRSFRFDDPDFKLTDKGAWGVLAENRVQLPHVVVEAIPKVTSAPLQVGDESLWVRQDVLLHVLAETRQDMKFLHDVLLAQKNHILLGMDKNAVLGADAMPLDAGGSPRGGALMYPALASTYGWKQLYLKDARSTPQACSPPLYYALVRLTVEVDMP
jgi:hypothetical protein